MPDIFDEFAMQTEEDDEAKEPDIFDQLASEKEEEDDEAVIALDEDRGGDLGLPGGDVDVSDVDRRKTDKPEPEDLSHIPGAYREQYKAGQEIGERLGDKTVKQALVGETPTEEVPAAIATAAKRVPQSFRKGGASSLEMLAAIAEKDEKRHKGHAINPMIMKEAVEKAVYINPDAGSDLIWDQYDELMNKRKAEIAAKLRKAKGIVGTEVDPTGFEGGFAKKLDTAVAGMAEFGVPMIATAINAPAGIALTFAQLFGGKYEEALEKYGDKERSFKVAFIHAAAGTPVESLGNIIQIRALGKMLKNMKLPGAVGKGIVTPSYMMKLAKQVPGVIEGAVAEGFEESIQTYTEAFADTVGDAPEGATPDEIQAMFLHIITTDTFKKSRNEAAEIGAIGGGVLGMGGVAVASSADLKKLITAKWEAFRADKHFLDNVEIARQRDIDEDRAPAGDGDIDQVESGQLQGDVSDNQKTAVENQAAARKEDKDALEQAQDEQAAAQQEQAQAQAEEQDRQAAAKVQEQKAAEAQQRAQYVEKTSTFMGLLEASGQLDSKPINDARKALVTEEDSIKKLKSLEYDLKNDKELIEQGFEHQTVANGLADIVRDRIDELELAETQKTEADLLKTGEKVVEQEEKAAEAEAKKAEVSPKVVPSTVVEKPKPAKDLFDTFAEDAAEAAELEEKVEAEIKAQKAEEAKKEAAEKAKVEPTVKKMLRFKGPRARAREKQLGLTKAQIAKRDAEKRIVPVPAPTVSEMPTDLKAAIKLGDGTVITGTSHFDIMGQLTDEQIEKVDFAKVGRGFTSKESGFLTVDESTKRFGVTKSGQLPITKKVSHLEVADPAAVFLRTEINDAAWQKERSFNKAVTNNAIKTGAIKVGEAVRFGEFQELNKVLNSGLAGYSKDYGDVKYAERVASSEQTIDAGYGTKGKRHFGIIAPAGARKTDGEWYIKPDADATQFKFIFPGQTKLLSFNEARGHQLEAFSRKQKGKGVIKRLEATRQKPVKGAMTQAQAQERVNQIDPKYTAGKKIVVVATEADLSPGVRAEAEGSPAFYFIEPGQKQDEGTIYLVADKTKNNLDLMINLWHEMGHLGFAKLAKDLGFGKDFETLLKEVKDKDAGAVLAYQTQFKISEDIAAEEVLVNKLETQDQTFIAKGLRLLRKMLNTLGVKVASQSQITGILENMRREIKGKPIQRIEKGYTETLPKERAAIRKALAPMMKNLTPAAKQQTLNYAEALMDGMPQAYKEHFEVLTSEEAGTAEVRLEKIGELKQDAKTVVTLLKDGDVGHFLEAFGYFAARRLLKRGEAKGLYNEWLKTKPDSVKTPEDWQRWFAKSFAEWNLARHPAPTSNMTKAFNAIKNAMKAIYLRFKGYATEQTAVQSMFEDIVGGKRDIVSDKYFYSDQNIMDRYLFGVEPSPQDMARQGFSKNNKTFMSYDPGNICPKTEEFAGWLHKQFEEGNVELKDLTDQQVWVDLMEAAREERIDVPCSYCYVEQNRRAAVILHNQGEAKSRVDYEKVKTMLTAVPYIDYLIKKNKKGEFVFTDAQVAEANQSGGMRMFSFSDYIKTAHRAQIELMLEHAKMRGLSIKAITKRAEFVEDFAHTGITINMSIDTEGTGMDHSTAYKLAEKYPNAHVRTVAKNPADFVRLGKDAKIGIITLFHGTKETTPPGYESMSYKSKSVQEILEKQPELRTKTCCLNEAKCFNGKKNTQCVANCGAGMHKLTIPKIVTAAEAQINRNLWDHSGQAITSADTSINEKKMPTLFSKYTFEAGETVFDIGGGRFDNVTDHLRKSDVIHRVYDPFNRTAEHNDEVLSGTKNEGGADVATVVNVLNVIAEPKVRERVILQAADIVKEGGRAIFGIYEGDGTGVGKVTTKGYQTNMKTAEYVSEVQEIFPNAVKKGNFIVATSEVAQEAVIKKVTRLIPEGEIVQPVAPDEAVSVIKHKYKPAFGKRDISDRKELIQRSFFQERRRLWVDHLDILKQLESGQDIDDTMSGYKSATLISNAPAMIDTFLEYGNIRMEENWMRVTGEGKGLAKIIEELGENGTAFFDWITAKSGQELLDRFGKQNLWGQDKEGNKIDDQDKINDIMLNTKDVYEANKEQWDAIELQLRDINKQVMTFMKDAGLITDGQYDHMRDTYIPFYRQIEDVFGETIETLIPRKGKVIQTTKTLKGSEISEIGDPLTNLISGYSFFINESLRNLAWVKSLKMAKELGLVERVHKGQKGGKNVIAIRVDGEPVHYKVMNTGLFDTLVGTAQSNVNVPGWLRAPKRWLTWGVTIMPRFRAFNILRDTLSAAFMNKSIIPFVDTWRGLVHTMRRSNDFVEWSSTGGNFTGSYSKRDIQASTERGIEKLKKKLTRKKNNGMFEFARSMKDLWERVGEVSESANRMGIFLAEKRTGASVTKAAFESRDLLDFHRKGAGKIAQVLIQTVPFLNARIQGLDKMARSATDQNKKRFWTAASIMVLASTALHFFNEDREDYQKLSDWEKIAYWHFYVGDQHFRIPTPFEVGSIFGALPLAITEAIRGDRSMKELGTFAFTILANTFAFNPIPHLFKPILEQLVNFDLFRWAPIEGMRDEGVESELRFSDGTGPTAKLISKMLPNWKYQSPKRIEKFIRDYLGGAGDGAMGIMDMATQYLDPHTDPAGTQLDNLLYISGVEGFVPSLKSAKEPAYTKYTDQYYDLLAEANMAYNSMRVHNQRLEGEDLVKKEFQFATGLELKRILKPYQGQISRINKELRMLRFEGYSPKQQRHEKEKLLAERNKEYMDAVKEAKAFIKKGD